ncbi:MAG TPA: aromatic ring-hydroxylating dioxygenase subunit alpha [Chloroflexia bacterium]|nr:aromatic ring-hydroxylating dioxygenase subunit alpha [Chloroflexia bacterium]
MSISHRRIGVEEGLKSGLRNRWYVMLSSDKLGGQPVGVKALGEKFVLWRDAQGKAHCFTDFCPHRGAPLSLGEVVNGELACGYHGIRFDGEGACTAVPAEGEDSKLQKRLKMQAYPVQERAGLVWAYIGDVRLFPPSQLRLPPELESEDWSGFICNAHWKTNWLVALDNLADPMHAPFLHGRSYTLRFGSKQDRMIVVDMPDGFRVEREKQKGINFDWSELGDTGALWCRLDIPYPKSAGPGGPLRIVGFITPNDENESEVYFLRYRQVQGWQRKLWRTLYRTRLEARHWHVLEQDRVMMEAMDGLRARLGEHLSQTDVGVIRLRKMLNMEYARQQEIYRQAAEAERTAKEQSLASLLKSESDQATAETAVSALD